MSNYEPSIQRPFRPLALKVAGRLAGLAYAAGHVAKGYIISRAVRRSRQELESLDDRLLRDIGLDRARLEALLRCHRPAPFAIHKV